MWLIKLRLWKLGLSENLAGKYSRPDITGRPQTCQASPDRNKKYFTYKIELDLSDETVLPFNLRTLFCSQQFVTWALTVRAVDYAGNSGQFSFPQFMQGMSQSSKWWR